MTLFEDISYKVLQLTVTSGQANLSKLNIFKETKTYISTLGLTIHAGIIGTSHFVQLTQDNGQCFTELFACETLEGEQPEPLCYLPIEALNDSVQLESQPFLYEFDCKRQDYDKTALDITNWANYENQNQPLIFLDFDFNTTQQGVPPSRTILVVHQKENGIAIQTVHEYQEENAIIVSKSRISLSSPF